MARYVFVAAIGATLLFSCAPDRAPVAPPAVTSIELPLAVVSPGSGVQVFFGASAPIAGCAATVDVAPVECALAAPGRCACGFVVPASAAEATLVVELTARCDTGEARGTARVDVDATPPAVNAAAFSIVRHPLAVEDGVVGLAGAVSDEGGRSYPGRSARTVTLWSDPVVSAHLADVVLDADGGFAEAAIPGNGVYGAAPPRVWASARDAAGNESARVEIVRGAALGGPHVDGTRIRIVRRPVGQVDGVAGDGGAFAGACAVKSVALYEGEEPGSPLVASAAATAVGGFEEIAVGTATRSYPRLWAAATDKCWLEGSRLEIQDGRDLTPPAVDATRVQQTTVPAGEPGAVAGVAGAVDPADVVTVRAYAARSGGSAVAAATPAADGSFPSTSTGTTPLFELWIEAEDKAGNVSPRVRGGDVIARFTLAGRRSGTLNPTPLAMWTVAWESATDRSPGFAPFRERESLDAAAAAAEGDGRFASTTAQNATYLDSSRWEALAPPSSPPPRAGLAMTYDMAREKGLVLGGVADASPCEVGGATASCGASWEWGAGTWTRALAGYVPGRTDAALAYDPFRARAILFGGIEPDGTCGAGGAYCSGTLEWSGAGDWIALDAPGPDPRSAPGTAFDTRRGRLVLFGGFNGSGTGCDGRPDGYCGATWEYDGSSWNRVSLPAEPPPRAHAAMTFEAGRGVVVLFGGEGPLCSSAPLCGDTWEYDGTAWREIAAAGTPPTPRAGAVAVYFAGRPSIVLFGGEGASGCDSGTTERCTATYVYDGATWGRTSVTSLPGGRRGHGMAYSTQADEVLMYGGTGASGCDGNTGSSLCTGTWRYWGIPPHARTAVHVFGLALPPGVAANSLAVRHVGAGSAAFGTGVRLLAYRAREPRGWIPLGSSAAAPPAMAAIDGVLPDGTVPDDVVDGDRLWIAAEAPGPSVPNVGSRVDSDYLRIDVRYTLP